MNPVVYILIDLLPRSASVSTQSILGRPKIATRHSAISLVISRLLKLLPLGLTEALRSRKSLRIIFCSREVMN